MKHLGLIVTSLHLVFFGLFFFVPKSKVLQKKPIQIHTRIEKPPKAAPMQLAQKKETKVAPKKVRNIPRKKVISSNRPKRPTQPQRKKALSKSVSSKLLQQLEERIAKIEENCDKGGAKIALDLPKEVKILAVEQNGSDNKEYQNLLTTLLQNALTLPSQGQVSVELTLTCQGKCKAIKILNSKSWANEQSLKEKLKELHYPPFSGSLNNENEHVFTITFLNN